MSSVNTIPFCRTLEWSLFLCITHHLNFTCKLLLVKVWIFVVFRWLLLLSNTRLPFIYLKAIGWISDVHDTFTQINTLEVFHRCNASVTRVQTHFLTYFTSNPWKKGRWIVFAVSMSKIYLKIAGIFSSQPSISFGVICFLLFLYLVYWFIFKSFQMKC